MAASNEELELIRKHLEGATPEELATIARALSGGAFTVIGIKLSEFQAGYVCGFCASLYYDQTQAQPTVVPIVRLFNPTE